MSRSSENFATRASSEARLRAGRSARSRELPPAASSSSSTSEDRREPCFQGFDQELAGLPGDYAPPRGRLYLALAGSKPAGCIALRPLFHRDAEMKRLYVRAAHRGSGLGRTLALRVIDDARALGYEVLKLDTLPAMRAAQRLYEDLGFRDTAPYNENPVGGVRFLALDLARAKGGRT